MCDTKEIVVRAASCNDELVTALKIRYEAYLKKGYILPEPSGMKADEWDDSRDTVHFAAFREHLAIGSVRLVLDSSKGLPMERVFPRAVKKLRDRGTKIAEASALVVMNNAEPEKRIWLRLCKAVWDEAKQHAVESLCIAVTENHLEFYKKLSFKIIGSGNRYATLNGIFAYPLCVTISDPDLVNSRSESSNEKSLRKFFLGSRGLKKSGLR